METTFQWIQEAERKILEGKLECGDPKLHARRIFEEALFLSARETFLMWNNPLSDEQKVNLDRFLARRLTGEPLQYISGYEHFWRARFDVGPGCLIPRRETEHLVETAIQGTRTPSKLKIAELGAGSGNIGISCLMERPAWEWHAFEVNPESLVYAERNARSLLKCAEAYRLHAGDFFEKAPQFGPYDIIVSNPPYVALSESISREVSHEPKLAVFGGERGDEILERLVEFASMHLKPGGIFLSEIGARQNDRMLRLLEKNGFTNIETIHDYQGHPRVMKGICGRTHH